MRHILGAAAYAARAAELARGDDPVVGEYMLYGAVRRLSPRVREVLEAPQQVDDEQAEPAQPEQWAAAQTVVVPPDAGQVVQRESGFLRRPRH